VAFRTPPKSKTRRKPFPIVRLPCIGIWNSAFALKVNSCRRLRVYGTDDALIEAGLVEERAFAGLIVGRSKGLPSHTAVQCEARGCLPGVLQVQTNIVLPEVLVCNSALSKAVRPSRHQVGEPRPRVDTRKIKGPGGGRAGRVIHHLVRWIHSESDLVCASSIREILG